MRIIKTVLVVLALGALPLRAADSPNNALDQVVDRIISHGTGGDELSQAVYAAGGNVHSESQGRQQSWAPFRPAINISSAARFLPRASNLEPLTDGSDTGGGKKKMFSGLGNMLSLSMEYLPQGFLQMIYLDTNGFDKQHYKFDYVRREFLGEVRTLVFDVTPLPKAGKGRFAGRIWVEDQDFHIVRFNGAYERQLAHQLLLPL